MLDLFELRNLVVHCVVVWLTTFWVRYLAGCGSVSIYDDHCDIGGDDQFPTTETGLSLSMDILCIPDWY